MLEYLSLFIEDFKCLFNFQCNLLQKFPPKSVPFLEIKMIPQRAVLLSAVTIAAIVGVVLVVSLTARLEQEYKEVGNVPTKKITFGDVYQPDRWCPPKR